MSDTTVNASTENRAQAALTAITGLALGFGLVLIIIGWWRNASVDTYSVLLSGDNPLPGLSTLALGGGLFSIGVMALFARLTVAAIRWNPSTQPVVNEPEAEAETP